MFICQNRGSSVRVLYTALPDGAKAGDLKQGLQLKPDRKAAIIGLVAHPSRESPLLLPSSLTSCRVRCSMWLAALR